MTTIALKNGFLAADTRGDDGLVHYNSKVEILGNRTFAALSGCRDYWPALLAWYREGCDPRAWPALSLDPDYRTTFLVIDGEEIWQYRNHCMGHPVSVRAQYERHGCWAWGSGRDLAIGAMLHGADAWTAVDLAMRVDPNTGGDIEVYEIATSRKCDEFSW